MTGPELTRESRGGERFVLRRDKRQRVFPFRIVREVDDLDFPGDRPVWVEAEVLGQFPSKEAARTFMIGRSAGA